MRKSMLGSIKSKLSRKNSDASQKSSTSSTIPETERSSSGPPTRAELRSAVLGGDPIMNNRSDNPLANPSPPTRRPNFDPPPAYTPGPTTESGPAVTVSMPPVELDASRARHARDASPAPSFGSAVTTPEDPYAFLSTFDTVFVIDDSGSMAGRSWREVKEALRVITPICTAHDADGIDVYFLNHRSSSTADPRSGKAAGGYRGLRDAAAVERLFAAVRPGGGTPTGTRLHQILRPYLQLLTDHSGDLEAVKPVNVIVVTDGVPSDDVESVLVNAARKLDRLDAPPYQVGVQFFQVGNEPGAKAALKELDDGLAEEHGDIRDMVDTVTWDVRSGGQTPVLTADGILKTVLGAVIRRLDRRRASAERLRP